LNLQQQVGQLLCFGWQGEYSDSVNDHARALIEELHVGAVILMARNVGTAESTRGMIRDIQSLSEIPLLVAVDQEGGRVNRFGPPIHRFPGNAALGRIPNRGAEYARRQAQVTARELRAIGVNWDFAPVLDVNNNPANPVIGDRSYSADPGIVADLGTAAIQGYQSEGILACAKHFPGHGDTSVDSHLDLPTITVDRNRMDSVELVPFRAGIEAGVASIMTAHILFPALDPLRPATMSHEILTGLLREEMGYEGIVITDCLEMKAIADGFGSARGAVEAIKAGADMVLACHTLETQREIRDSILAAVGSGEIPDSLIEASMNRIRDAREGFVREPPAIDPTPWLDPAHDALEREIERLGSLAGSHV